MAPFLASLPYLSIAFLPFKTETVAIVSGFISSSLSSGSAFLPFMIITGFD
ncbi:hypothetical protein RCH18_003063 [Flavobacterium sp. PL11]|uniref:hypothetical protein n=1 Tax=Flavobacterium sp. PL11 TaxID=3071717 RepID=UPI002E028235|nr:hypothetical protein [Flavobacterium sp. PL11]